MKISQINFSINTFSNLIIILPQLFKIFDVFCKNVIHVNFQYFLQIMAQNVNPRPSGTTTFDKDAADRGSSTSSAQVSQKI